MAQSKRTVAKIVAFDNDSTLAVVSDIDWGFGDRPTGESD